MTYSAISRLLVIKDGREVATLERTRTGCRFAYQDDHLASGGQPIAYRLTQAELVVEGKYNLPMYFSGLLPEGVMSDALISRARISRDDLFSQLALTGHDPIGDVSIVAPDLPPIAEPKRVEDVREFLKEYLSSSPDLRYAGISGVIPKMSLRQVLRGFRQTAQLVKLEPPGFPGVLANEAATMIWARRAGFDTAQVRLHGPDLLVINRFDRVPQPDGSLKMRHVEDTLQLLDAHPYAKYSLDYLEILDLARELASSLALILDLLRLYLLSWLVGNGDLHAKNVSFIRDEAFETWTLTPIYDLVCTLAYPELNPTMALALDEQRGDFRMADLVKVAEAYRIPPLAAERAFRRVVGRLDRAMKDRPWPYPDFVVDELFRRRARFLD